jgi:hypothetical protein
MIFWVTMPFRPRRRSLGKGLGEAAALSGTELSRTGIAAAVCCSTSFGF